jgi:hypothetical protein
LQAGAAAAAAAFGACVQPVAAWPLCCLVRLVRLSSPPAPVPDTSTRLPAPPPQKNEGIDLRKDRQALQRLTEAAEKAKIELSATTQTSINLPFITATAEGPKHIDQMLTKAKFEEICNDLLVRCKRPVEQALKDAKLSISDIQEVGARGRMGHEGCCKAAATEGHALHCVCDMCLCMHCCRGCALLRNERKLSHELLVALRQWALTCVWLLPCRSCWWAAPPVSPP